MRGSCQCVECIPDRLEPKFRVGDVVTFVNDYGVRFPERFITDIEVAPDGEFRYYFTPHDAYWCPAKESNLILDADDPVIDIVNGHRIREVYVRNSGEKTLHAGERLMFQVGTTQEAFADLQMARAYAASAEELPFDIPCFKHVSPTFLEVDGGARLEEADSRVIMALPIKPYRPEGLRVVEYRIPEDLAAGARHVWFSIQALRDGQWVAQKTSYNRDEAMQEAARWAPEHTALPSPA